MELMRRLAQHAGWSRTAPKGAVMLRHASGHVLSVGAMGEPLEFPDTGDAEAFRLRWLDEPEAWTPVTDGCQDLSAA